MAQDAFGTDSVAGWGDADVGGPWTHRFSTGTDATSSASVSGGWGNLNISTGSSLLILVSYVGSNTEGNYDVVSTVRADRTSGAYLMVAARLADHNDHYAAQINLGGNTFSIRKTVAGGWTTLGTGPTPSPAFAANTDYKIRFQLQGTALKAKWWLAADSEPAAWAVEVTDTAFSVGQVGAVGVLTATRSTGNYSFDDFVASPLPAVLSLASRPSTEPFALGGWRGLHVTPI